MPRKHSPKVDPHEWVGGRTRLPAYVESDEPFRPELVLWASGGLVLHATAVHPRETDEAVVAALLEAMARPMVGDPRSPRRVRVASPGTADALRGRLDPSIEVVLAPTPEVDELAARFADHMTGAPQRHTPSYLEHGRLDEPRVRAFFLAARRLHRTAPWTLVPSDAHVLGLSIPSLGLRDLCVSIVGQLDRSAGLIIFASVAAYRAFRDESAHRAPGDGRAPGTRFFSISFDHPRTLPRTMRDELAIHRWPTAGDHAAPVIAALDEDRVPVPLTADDLDFARVAVDALATFFELHGAQLLAGPGATPIDASIAASPAIDVRIQAPHPAFSLARDAYWTQPEARDEERADAAALCGAFLGEERERGRDEAWLGVAEVVVHGLFEHGAAGASGAGLTAAFVTAYMTQIVPARVPLFGDPVEHIPPALAAFFAWMARTARIDAARGAALAATARELAGACVRAARDKSRFGVAKRLIARMVEDGVDVTDPAAVQRFLVEQGDHKARPKRRR